MRLGLTRRNIGRLVLLAWAVALAWLARREFAKSDTAALTESTRRLEPGAQYFAVLVNGRQVGQLNLSVDTLVDGVRQIEQFVLDLPVGDSTRQMARGTEYFLSRALRLRTVARTVFGTGPAERLDLAIGTDSLLSLTDTEDQQNIAGRGTLRIEPDVILSGMLQYRAAFGGHLRVGESFSVPLLELGTSEVRPLAVRVMAESTFIVPDSASWDSVAAKWVPATSDTVQAWRLEHDAPGALTWTWVDAGGAVVRQETAGGFTLVRSAFEIVQNNYRRFRRTEHSGWRRAIPGMIALIATRHVLDTTGGTRKFLVQPDSGATLAGPPRGLTGGRQSLRGDTLTVLREEPRSAEEPPAQNTVGQSWETARLDAGIRATATLAIGRAATRRDSARALTRWVARQVATDSAPGAFGTALNALRARRGNADAKARLLTTLARAAGIPARVVTGVAVLADGVFSHAWAELWLGRWVAADPSFGHLPASTALVRIALGERSRPVDLLPLVASARFLPLRPAP